METGDGDVRSILPGFPALHALLIQSLACVVTVGTGFALAQLVQWHMPLLLAAGLQGALAAGLAYHRCLAPWWVPIQLLFPLALLGTLALHLPSWVFLAGFILLLVLFWSSFRTQVPFYPSRKPVWQAVHQLLPVARPLRFLDVGSGMGGMVLYLAAARGAGTFTGIEIAPLPWLYSFLCSRISRSRARFIRGDYRELDFAEFDVVFAYLSPAAMPALWSKAQREMSRGSLLLSYEFAIPGIDPALAVSPTRAGAPLYAWSFPGPHTCPT